MSNYKMSNYNCEVKLDNDKYLLFNTLKQGLVLLDLDSYKEYSNIDITSPYKEKYIEYGLWTKENFNEIDYLKYKHRSLKYSNTILDITVQVTNDCNFLCKYCYQEHNPKYLSEESINKLKKFIINKVNSGVQKVRIHWFGGEPTLNFSKIKDIEQYLMTNDIKCENSMTTNGFLLNNELSNQLKNTNINLLQITIDGTKDSHNSTRQLKNGDGTFNIIINNIKNIIKTNKDIKITIRYNINNKNFLEIENFLIMLKENNLNNKNINLLFQETFKHDILYTEENIFFKNRAEYSEKLLYAYKLMNKYNYKLEPSGHIGVNCKFDMKNSMMFDTDMKVVMCSSNNSRIIGFINENYEIDYIQDCLNYKLLKEPFDDKKCLTCKVLPMCMGGCSYLESTSRNKCIPQKYIINDLIKLYYESAKKL